MISFLLLAGGLLVLVVITLAWLEPVELLRPSRRSQLIAGLVGGGVSALVLLSLRSGPDGMAVVVHPTATAFLGLYFGPLAALVSAAIALAAQLALPQPPWGAAISVLAGAFLAASLSRSCPRSLFEDTSGGQLLASHSASHVSPRLFLLGAALGRGNTARVDRPCQAQQMLRNLRA